MKRKIVRRPQNPENMYPRGKQRTSGLQKSVEDFETSSDFIPGVSALSL
jgi:hypothetical protein